MSKQRSEWAVGYAAFAAVILMIAGVAGIMSGFAAILKDEFFVVTQKWAFTFDVTAWGWVHLILGAVLLLSGFLVLSGNLFGRIIGVAVAALNIVVFFMWMPYYPGWSIVLIALCIAVIWALTLHGRDIVED